MKVLIIEDIFNTVWDWEADAPMERCSTPDLYWGERVQVPFYQSRLRVKQVDTDWNAGPDWMSASLSKDLESVWLHSPNDDDSINDDDYIPF